ncbi:MAG TPA: (Na+)-NQR maturation NqrM [Bacteroidetes bacterium]|jgi:hypothetical protein|nr:(Na+)-NQR maturation NqrM [Bacteroidota bacterium]
MKYFVITLVVMVATLLGMAVGVIFSNKRLKGSCGGLNKVLGEDCLFCDKKDECSDEKKAQCEGPAIQDDPL